MKIYLHKGLIDEYEEKGLVADSYAVRIDLLARCRSEEITLEQMRDQLKKLQREAHSKGLYKRLDFFNDRGVDLEPAMAKQKLKDIKQLYKKLNSKIEKKKENAPRKKI